MTAVSRRMSHLIVMVVALALSSCAVTKCRGTGGGIRSG